MNESGKINTITVKLVNGDIETWEKELWDDYQFEEDGGAFLIRKNGKTVGYYNLRTNQISSITIPQNPD